MAAPKKSPPSKRQNPISFRPSSDTKAIIDRWANDQGVSSSKAIDALIRIGFERRSQSTNQIRDLFGTLETAYLCMLIAAVVDGVESKTQARWFRDKRTCEEVIDALTRVLTTLKPITSVTGGNYSQNVAKFIADLSGPEIDECPGDTVSRAVLEAIAEWTVPGSSHVYPWRSDPEGKQIIDEMSAARWLAKQLSEKLDGEK